MTLGYQLLLQFKHCETKTSTKNLKHTQTSQGLLYKYRYYLNLFLLLFILFTIYCTQNISEFTQDLVLKEIKGLPKNWTPCMFFFFNFYYNKINKNKLLHDIETKLFSICFFFTNKQKRKEKDNNLEGPNNSTCS